MIVKEEQNLKTKLNYRKGSLSREEKREISLRRAKELKTRIEDYLEARATIPTGFTETKVINQQKQKLLRLLGATETDWQDWRWQMQNRISDAELLAELIDLNQEEKQVITEVGRQYRWAVSPYYLSLINPSDPHCPVRLQAIPSKLELCNNDGHDDPMGEEFTNPAECITRRYPDRLIINVTNMCAMYCRHCQRRRNIGEVDTHKTREELQASLDYIRANPEIRDVLITGGDAALLSNQILDWLLRELDNIPHVEIKRLGTRTLVTMPQRITEAFCQVIEKHPPIYINTQFNHPREITPEVLAATDKLIKAGAVLGNQAVLLNKVNNNAHVMKKLNQELLKARIRPYYIFHAKTVKGTSHFLTKVEEGISIMEQLRGYTSGLAIPTYIINAPKGNGKTPMLPEYLISAREDQVTIRTWENKVIDVPNVKTWL